MWSAPGEQDKLQEALEIGGAGYPALAALNIKKTAVLHHRGGFSSDSINEFLQYVNIHNFYCLVDGSFGSAALKTFFLEFFLRNILNTERAATQILRKAHNFSDLLAHLCLNYVVHSRKDT